MIVTFICTGHDTHDPQVIYVYDGDIPVPQQWTAYPRGADLDLNCGQCSRSPRPGTAALRVLIEAAASDPSRMADISFANL